MLHPDAFSENDFDFNNSDLEDANESDEDIGFSFPPSHILQNVPTNNLQKSRFTPLPPEAIPYDLFLAGKGSSKQKEFLGTTKAVHVSGFYEFGPYGDICRAWESVLISHFPDASLPQIEALLKQLFSQTGQILIPPQFSSPKSS